MSLSLRSFKPKIEILSQMRCSCFDWLFAKLVLILAARCPPNRTQTLIGRREQISALSAVATFFLRCYPQRKIRAQRNKQIYCAVKPDVWKRRRFGQQIQMCKCAIPRFSRSKRRSVARARQWHLFRSFHCWHSPVSWIIYSMINVRNATVFTVFFSSLFLSVYLSFGIRSRCCRSALLLRTSSKCPVWFFLSFYSETSVNRFTCPHSNSYTR